MAQDMGNIKLILSSTGDNCLSVKRNGISIGSNTCTKPAEDFYNPYQKQQTYTLSPVNKKAGSTALQIQICAPITTDICITKSQVIQILPGPVNKIELRTPTDILIE